jgi:hypothetical protein
MMGVFLCPIAIPLNLKLFIQPGALLSPSYTPKTKLRDFHIEDDNSTDAGEHSSHMAVVKQMRCLDQPGWNVRFSSPAKSDAAMLT